MCDCCAYTCMCVPLCAWCQKKGEKAFDPLELECCVAVSRHEGDSCPAQVLWRSSVCSCCPASSQPLRLTVSLGVLFLTFILPVGTSPFFCDFFLFFPYPCFSYSFISAQFCQIPRLGFFFLHPECLYIASGSFLSG